MEYPSTAGLTEPGVRLARTVGLAANEALAEIPENGDSEQWVELPEQLRFTFAGFYVAAANFRCLTLLRSLDAPPYRLTPSLFRLLPEGVRALRTSQTISVKLPPISRIGRGVCYVPLQDTRFFIDLDGSFEAYIGKFKKKKRYTMKRKIRLFTEACGGAVVWREFRCPEGMAEFHTLASGISRKTYQHRLLRAGIDTSASFRQEMILGAIERRSRGYILYRQQTAIAYMYCRVQSGDLVLEKTGFDPLFAGDSPGFVLFWFVLQRLFAGGEFRRVDLYAGAYPYKAHLATGGVEVAEIYYFPWNYRNVTLVLAHAAVVAASNLLRSALATLGVLRPLKKMVRYGAAPFRARADMMLNEKPLGLLVVNFSRLQQSLRWQGIATTLVHVVKKAAGCLIEINRFLFFETDLTQPLVPLPELSIPLELRLMTTGDIQSFADLFNARGLKMDTVEHRLARGDKCILACSGLAPAGYHWLCFSNQWIAEIGATLRLAPREVYSYDVVTLAEWRGNRVQAAMGYYARQYTQARGYLRHLTYIRADNPRSLRGLARLGPTQTKTVWSIRVLGRQRALLLFGARQAGSPSFERGGDADNPCH